MFRFDPPKNIRKPLVFWCFQSDQKETLEEKGLIAILKWRNHPSALAILSVYRDKAVFSFTPIAPRDVQKEISILYVPKAVQECGLQ